MTDSPETTLLGRDRELSELARLAESAAGGRGQFVLLSGEAGVGKTRLAEEALTRCPMLTCAGRSREETAPPYSPLITALRDCLGSTRAAAGEIPPLWRHLGDLIPELGPPPGSGDSDTLVEAMAAVIVHAARTRGVAMFIDDLHWADNATLEILPALVERLNNHAVLMLATYRSDEITRGHPLRRLRHDLRRSRRMVELSIGPLSRGLTANLMSSVLEETPAPRAIELVFAQTHGIPLYVEELSRALMGSGRLRQTDLGLDMIPGEAVPVPESVRDAILLRLDELSEPARRKLEIAAVAGTEFDLDVLTALSDDDRGVEELLDRSLLREVQPGQGAFRHALICEAVRSGITWSRRRQLHRDIGDYLSTHHASPELIAEHWLKAKEHDRARLALLDAAERSCRIHAYRDAARSAFRALEIWPDGADEEERLNTLERLAHCAQVSGQLPEAVRACREIIDSLDGADRPRRLGEAWRSLATLYGLQGAWEQALEGRRAAANAFEAADLPGEAAAEVLAAARQCTATLQLEPALESSRRAASLADRAGQWDIKARAMALEGDVLGMLGDTEEGRRIVRDGLTLAMEHNLTDAASDVYRRLASTHAYASDYIGAREAYTAAIDFCRTHGEVAHEQVCLGCMSYVLFQTGEWGRAIEVCREVINNESTPPGTRVPAEIVLGMIYAFRGEVRLARRHLQGPIGPVRNLRNTAAELLCYWGLAALAELDGATGSVEAHYRTLLERWQATEERHDVIPAFCSAVTFFATQDARQEMTRCAEALSTIAAATGNAEALAGLAYALGEVALHTGQADQAYRQFSQAIAHLESLTIPFSRSQTEYRAGVAATRAGMAELATAHLDTALRTARRLGARPVAGSVAAVIQEANTSSAESAGTGEPPAVDRSGLTRRQMEVAKLLATGLTNKEIAGKLFLSPRTVDMHVSHILERLDCRSRAEAARKVAEFGLD